MFFFGVSGADKSLARPTSRCISFDGENISFDANLCMYVCVCVCVYIYIYIHTHTHTHTYTEGCKSRCTVI